MRIPCPHCGPRDLAEFVYRGDAAVRRPESGDGAAMIDYVYLRDNARGAHRELWFHAHGCRAWCVVARDTATHAISDASVLRGEGAE